MSVGLLATLALHLTAGAAPADGNGNELLKQIEVYQQSLFDELAPSVVLLRTAEGIGSGFFVASNGLILTNNHVVKDCKTADVVLHDGRRLQGIVVERALENVDLALVQVPLQNAPAVRLVGMKGLKVGSFVGSIGHGSGAIWTFNTGMVSNIYRDGTDRPVFQTQIPLNPGNSGGPIFDRDGQVVGVLTSGIKDANAINFSISIEVARRSLPALARLSDSLVINAPANVPVFVDNVVAGKGPRVVVPATPGTTYQVFAIIDGQMKRAEVRFPDVRELTLK